jgi:hypothetical protein
VLSPLSPIRFWKILACAASPWRALASSWRVLTSAARGPIDRELFDGQKLLRVWRLWSPAIRSFAIYDIQLLRQASPDNFFELLRQDRHRRCTMPLLQARLSQKGERYQSSNVHIAGFLSWDLLATPMQIQGEFSTNARITKMWVSSIFPSDIFTIFPIRVCWYEWQ